MQGRPLFDGVDTPVESLETVSVTAGLEDDAAKQRDTPADDTVLQPVSDTHPLELDISFQLTRTGKGRAATAVNVELILSYWHIGDWIGRDILKSERHGKRILSTLSKELIAEYGPGYSQSPRLITAKVLTAQYLQVSVSRRALSQSHCRTIQAQDYARPPRCTGTRHRNQGGTIPSPDRGLSSGLDQESPGRR